VDVFRDLRFEVLSGEFVATVGPSGSGKSTLLNILVGFDRPDTGRVTVDGVDVTTLSESELAAWRLRTVGFVFQAFNLISVLTALENVEVPLRKLGIGRAKVKEQSERALRLVGLSGRADHYPRELSGGEEQRVAIARAIASDPKLIVADEPTGNLDAKAALGVLDILRTLNQELGKTIVLVTHDPVAAAYASRSIDLRKGLDEPEPDVSDVPSSTVSLRKVGHG
jgi:putative ABC transport system ATP-binding protein